MKWEEVNKRIHISLKWFSANTIVPKYFKGENNEDGFISPAHSFENRTGPSSLTDWIGNRLGVRSGHYKKTIIPNNRLWIAPTGRKSINRMNRAELSSWPIFFFSQKKMNFSSLPRVPAQRCSPSLTSRCYLPHSLSLIPEFLFFLQQQTLPLHHLKSGTTSTFLQHGH